MPINSFARNCLLHWVREREKIRLLKESGAPQPWTEDKILATYRFTNVRREDDRVTRWVKEHIRDPYVLHPNLPVMLTIARLFNNPSTLKLMVNSGGWPKFDQWDAEQRSLLIEAVEEAPRPWFNAAYMVKGWPGSPKHHTLINNTCMDVFNLCELVRQARTVAVAHADLMKARDIAEFLAYQIVIDLRHAGYFYDAPDRETFAAYGPGTRRGLNRMYGLDANIRISDRDTLSGMLNEVKHIIDLETDMNLHVSDVTNVMCELDKYMRALIGEGRPKQYYRPFTE